MRAHRSTVFAFALACAPVPALAAEAPRLALCPGFTIVTAVNESARDYESIKTIDALDDAGVHMRYSSEAMVYDWLSPGPGELKKTNTQRILRREDLKASNLYLQHFGEQLPDLVPETTAISISSETLRVLKTEGKTDFGIFIPFNVDKPGVDREKHPNVYDNQMVTTVTRTPGDATLQVVVNDKLVAMPVVHFEGDFYGDKSEFYVLDDPNLPLMLKFRIGIDANQPLSADEVEQRKLLGMPTAVSRDKEVLRVVKIIAPCKPEPPAAAPAQAPAAAEQPVTAVQATSTAIEQAVEAEGRANIEAIFFTVDSANLRPESDVALTAIADMMRRHPDWKFNVEGHTDSQGGGPYNLDLSKRRAAAVKTALTTRFSIAADRLTSTGYGLTKPIADNATLEGRARNRRVELVRLP